MARITPGNLVGQEPDIMDNMAVHPTAPCPATVFSFLFKGAMEGNSGLECQSIRELDYLACLSDLAIRQCRIPVVPTHMETLTEGSMGDFHPGAWGFPCSETSNRTVRFQSRRGLQANLVDKWGNSLPPQISRKRNGNGVVK